MTISLLKIKFGVVVNERALFHFMMETKFLRMVMWLVYISAQALIMGSVIRLIRGV